jgi:hypothetical protein
VDTFKAGDPEAIVKEIEIAWMSTLANDFPGTPSNTFPRPGYTA